MKKGGKEQDWAEREIGEIVMRPTESQPTQRETLERELPVSVELQSAKWARPSYPQSKSVIR